MVDVIKQGVLKKEPNLEKNKRISGFLAKWDSPKWCVLVIREGTPYFEIYTREEDMFTGMSCMTSNLTKCKQVTYTLSRRTKIFTFCIVLSDDVIQLVAATKQQMLSWVKTIESCLDKLGILESKDDAHIYTFCPAVVNRKGKSADDEAGGAVGGVDDEEDEDENPYHLAEEEINILDAEGENIFSTIREVDVTDLHRKASVGDVDSQMKLGKLFHFDWTKEPESFPIIESEATSIPSPAHDDETGCDLVDEKFWEKNRVSKVMPDELFGGISERNRSVDDDLDLDDGYCGLKELAQVKAKYNNRPSWSENSMQSTFASVNASASPTNPISPTYSNLPCTNPISPTYSNLPFLETEGAARVTSQEKSTKVCKEYCDGSPKSNENDYAPFLGNPIKPLQKDQSNTSSLAALEMPVHPIPKPRKLSLPRSNCLLTNHVLDDSRKPTNEIHGVSFKPTNEINDGSSKPTDQNQGGSSKPTDQRISVEEIADIGASVIPTKQQNGEWNENFNADLSEDEDSGEEYVYEHISDRKISLPLPLNVAPPLLPKRTDSLVPQVPPLTNPPPINNPPIPIRTNLTAPPPSLPPRNKSKSGAPPPIPLRSSSFHVKNPPDIPRRDVAVPERKLSNRMRVDHTNSVHTVISLKQNQMDILREEMTMSNVSFKLESRFFQGLALVDVCDKVWIAGWNVNLYPRLHNKFHIGDQILHINNVKVTSAAVAMKTIKQTEMFFVDMTIRRLPKAKVFVIRRSAEGEQLGIKREKGTAEIVYVDPQGLAGKNDLHQKPMMMSGLGTCNWFITEINSRPLNLFFKNMEIEHRLGAVGRDISFVVQPSDFIFELKKQLKKMSGYKNYLIN